MGKLVAAAIAAGAVVMACGGGSAPGGEPAGTVTFTVGGAKYTGRINGSAMQGTMTSGGKSTQWKATKSAAAATR